jgi:hypothetical protein
LRWLINKVITPPSSNHPQSCIRFAPDICYFYFPGLSKKSPCKPNANRKNYFDYGIYRVNFK